ncbi:MAG TPA: hypothetical protein VK400_13095, partial [Pyrinomonadaceae bacterium]|nr:hypothetical protein [Pyrinomonadaceae bacterium]
MNFRAYLSLPTGAVFLAFCCFFASCARKEKAVLDLHIEEKVIQVKHDEVVIDDSDLENISNAGQSSQTAPQKLSDFSEVTVMYDGFGNKLERRFFRGHPRLDTVIVKTTADGRREIMIYGQNGERKTIDGELGNRLLTASADEIANAAKIYETRPDRSRMITIAG